MTNPTRIRLHAALFCLLTGFVSSAEPSLSALPDPAPHGGLIVHLGCGNGTRTLALQGARRVVLGLSADAAEIRTARAMHLRKHVSGAVMFARLDGGRIPVVDGAVTALVVDSASGVPPAELARAVAPGGRVLARDGVFAQGLSGLSAGAPPASGWQAFVKDWPADIDDWTHYLHGPEGNAVAADRRVGPPRHMQWLADPMWSRNHHKLASVSAVVSAGGRLFTIQDTATAATTAVPGRWSLVARDAFNGVTLWDVPLESWAWTGRGFRSGPVQLPRMLVTDGARVFVPLAMSAPVSAMDARTGVRLATFPDTVGAEELVLSRSLLFVVAGSPEAEPAAVDPARRGRARYPNDKRVLAVDVSSGRTLWRWEEAADARYVPQSLAVSREGVFLQTGNGVTCLAPADGSRLWSTATPQADEDREQTAEGKRRGLGLRSVGWSVAALVVSDGVVLSADGRELTALDVKDGRRLWSCPLATGFRSPPDVFVIDGLVWLGSAFAEARDLRTGEIRRRSTVLQQLQTAGHHHRCYREKASERYIMAGYRGVEFLDIVGDNHSRNNWIRGVCQYGILPCNGLIYTPPHACGCYMEGKLYGFWAVAADRNQTPTPDSQPLEKGPAYGTTPEADGAAADWPTYRNNPRRSGSTDAPLPARLDTAWTVPVGDCITAPTAAEGLIYVVDADAHRLLALDDRRGDVHWTRHTGARVDSPPTWHNGLLLFGSSDGCITCLRARDGELVWRRRAAPEPRFAVVRDQFESVWPAHGSVLVQDETAYVTAGRYSYLDGGIRLLALDPATGTVKHRNAIRDDHPQGLAGADDTPPVKLTQNAVDSKTRAAPDRSDAFSMRGARSDVLVADGTSIYLRQRRFDAACRETDGRARHLFSTSRLLDNAENHRSHWVLGSGDFSRTPVAYSWIANRMAGGFGYRLAAPYGLMLAFNSTNVWGIRRPGRAYTLFRQPYPTEGGDPGPDFVTSDGRTLPPWAWSVSLDMRPRAMLVAGDTLVVGGACTAAEQTNPHAPFDGETGGLLWTFDARTGEPVASTDLPAPPVWDGMAAAANALYIATEDGKLICLRAADRELPVPQVTLSPNPHAKPSAPAGTPGTPGKPVTPDKDGKLVLSPAAAKTTGRLRYQPDRNNLGAWIDPKDTCQWNLSDVKAGTYNVEFAYGSTNPDVAFTIRVGDRALTGTTQHTGGLKSYKSFSIGTLELPAGDSALIVAPGTFKGAIMNFRLLTLTPAE